MISALKFAKIVLFKQFRTEISIKVGKMLIKLFGKNHNTLIEGRFWWKKVEKFPGLHPGWPSPKRATETAATM